MEVALLASALEWDNAQNIQDFAIKSAAEAIHSGELNPSELFQKLNKPAWENYCKIIMELGQPERIAAVETLLFLLQDMNWPGAPMALNLLADMEKTTLLPLVENTIIQAFHENDDMWLGGLKMLWNQAVFDNESKKSTDMKKMLSYANF